MQHLNSTLPVRKTLHICYPSRIILLMQWGFLSLWISIGSFACMINLFLSTCGACSEVKFDYE